VPGDKLSAWQRETKAAQLALTVIGAGLAAAASCGGNGLAVSDILESREYLIL
jgi:hypothetical protein